MSKLLLVKSDALPDVFEKVVAAKALLENGGVKNASDAARAVGISRSAFYKYRDCVFAYTERIYGKIITLHAMLEDKPGVLSQYIGELYRSGVNILTVNQDIPSGGRASVTVSVRVDGDGFDEQELLTRLKAVDGVKKVSHILG